MTPLANPSSSASASVALGLLASAWLSRGGASHPADWNDHGGMNYLIGKPVQPELMFAGGSFQAVLEAKKGKFKVVADDDVDPDREYWNIDYRDIIYDYPVE